MINIDTEHQNRSNVDGLNLGTVEKKKNRNNETFFFLLGMITILMNSWIGVDIRKKEIRFSILKSSQFGYN